MICFSTTSFFLCPLGLFLHSLHYNFQYLFHLYAYYLCPNKNTSSHNRHFHRVQKQQKNNVLSVSVGILNPVRDLAQYDSETGNRGQLQMDPDPINYEQRSLYSWANILVIIEKSLNVINTDWSAGQKEISFIIPTGSCAETHFFSQITVGDFWQQYLAKGSWDVHRYSVYSCRSEREHWEVNFTVRHSALADSPIYQL